MNIRLAGSNDVVQVRMHKMVLISLSLSGGIDEELFVAAVLVNSLRHG